MSPDNPRPKTLGVVVRMAEPPAEAPTFCAHPVWGMMPWIAGSEQGTSPDEALSRLEARLRRLGYEPELVVFDTVEEAEEEGRRRYSAGEMLHHFDAASRARLSAAIADDSPEGHEILGCFDRVAAALRAVATGSYDAERRTPPVEDGRIRCPRCGHRGDERGGFTAMSDALVTAFVNGAGECVDWKNAEQHDEGGFRALTCDSCGAELGDLTLGDLRALRPYHEEGGAS